MPRNYVSVVRRAQAETTRRRVIVAAAEMFSEHGYTKVSVRQIAARAGVSLDRLYNVGGKAGLLLQALEAQYSGTVRDLRLWDTREAARAVNAPTPALALDRLVDLLTASHTRSSGLWAALLEGAALDVELAGVLQIRERELHRQAGIAIDGAVSRGLIPPPRDLPTAIDVCWLTAHPSQYALLVNQLRWPSSAYRNWLRSSFTTLLLNDTTRV